MSTTVRSNELRYWRQTAYGAAILFALIYASVTTTGLLGQSYVVTIEPAAPHARN